MERERATPSIKEIPTAEQIVKSLAERFQRDVEPVVRQREQWRQESRKKDWQTNG